MAFTTTYGPLVAGTGTSFDVTIPPKTVGDYIVIVVDSTSAATPFSAGYTMPVDGTRLQSFQKYVTTTSTGNASAHFTLTEAADYEAFAVILHGDSASADPGTGSGTPTAAPKTRLLTQFHDTSVVTPMEGYTGMRYEGAVLFNDAGNITWGDIAAPWYADTSANLPAGWRAANPTVRNTFVVTQAPCVGSNAAEVINGSHDGDIYKSLQAAVKSFGSATIIRLGHEMNTWNGQYAWGYSNVSTTDYKAMWVKWVSIARAHTDTAGLRFDFCGIQDGRDMELWFPGAQYVDIISTDAYGSKYQSTNPTAADLVAWVKTDAPNSLTRLMALCRKYGKPYGFPEWAMFKWTKAAGTDDSRGSGDHAAYVDSIFDFINTNNGTDPSYPGVYCAYQSYFNRPDGGVVVTLDGNGNTTPAPALYAEYKTRNRALRPDLITA